MILYASLLELKKDTCMNLRRVLTLPPLLTTYSELVYCLLLLEYSLKLILEYFLSSSLERLAY